MSEFMIEKGIAIPTIVRGRARSPEKYPWSQMEVGDSFFTPAGAAKYLNRAAQVAGKRLGRKFSVRKVEGGQRTWRVA
ncbi:MAG: hypothetical protein M3O22_04985 [Pseudomonadota bacterium]|nr:hypothetical protein [Pseudomonadota bacterium]